MHALERRFKDRGLRFIGVTGAGGTDEERAEVERVAKEHHMTVPTYLDADGKFVEGAGLGSTPSFTIVGRDGRRFYRAWGKLTEGSGDYEKLAAALERALAAPKPAG